MKNRGIDDQTVLKLTYSLVQLVKGLESRFHHAKDYELMLFSYQLSTMINLLVRLHTHIHNKQIAHSFLFESRPPLHPTSEMSTHVLAAIARLSELVKTWRFPHKQIATLIENHLQQLQAFYLIEDHSHHQTKYMEPEENSPYIKPMQLELEEDLPNDEPIRLDLGEQTKTTDAPPMPSPTPPLLANNARIDTANNRKPVRPKPPLLTQAASVPTPDKNKNKSMRPKPVTTVAKVRGQKKMLAKRVSAPAKPPFVSNSVKVRIGNVTKVIHI
ncbi:hypothetical protein [Brevibacillus brevis]|uniref:hypothetical protein n=1 Tax=Brevibacillus brevis TaxID=1393 RepID=UPI000D0FB72F|nr:hypothetical protein [Brevibacillus brevis]PSJ65497.1 hypothetical protein C7J99_29090 [Brevibacillus brevis]RED33949.1 hypothetical protein DES34_102114 [Brevibacillus brevis]GEC89456.1 hypothetical protein BBR01nite_17870 [Brevibacillus brevis]VEF92481.1 Uncharacterised protein [Brevibacillus brevis]